MKLLAISGSIRAGSYNRALLKAMSELSSSGTTVTVYDGLKDIPIYDPNVADNAIPVAVADLMLKIRASDGVIISTAEYIYGVPGILKNVLDWLVSSDVLILKPVSVSSISTSSLGGVRAHSALILILHTMNASVVVDGSIHVPSVYEKFDENRKLTDELTKQAIKVSLSAIEQAVDIAENQQASA